MITYEMISNAQAQIITEWGNRGKRVIEECSRIKPFNGSSSEFLDYCVACGGNWGGMLLTGIRKLYPTVWSAIPNDMGSSAWACICAVLILCGVDTSK